MEFLDISNQDLSNKNLRDLFQALMKTSALSIKKISLKNTQMDENEIINIVNDIYKGLELRNIAGKIKDRNEIKEYDTINKDNKTEKHIYFLNTKHKLKLP